MARGGKREGAGRPRKHITRGVKIDVYLPEHQIIWLREKGNMSGVIQELIESEMKKTACK